MAEAAMERVAGEDCADHRPGDRTCRVRERLAVQLAVTGMRGSTSLQKPLFMPPGWAFGVVVADLYALMGIALAMILAEPPSDPAQAALILFFVQLALNFAWSPIFFGAHAHQVVQDHDHRDAGASPFAAASLVPPHSAARGCLMVPYLLWLCFALRAQFQHRQAQSGRWAFSRTRTTFVEYPVTVRHSWYNTRFRKGCGMMRVLPAVGIAACRTALPVCAHLYCRLRRSRLPFLRSGPSNMRRVSAADQVDSTTQATKLTVQL